MSKVRMKPLLGALLIIALMMSACIYVGIIEVYSYDYIYITINVYLHWPSCTSISYGKAFEMISHDYLRMEVTISTHFDDPPCSNIYYINAIALVDSWIELRFPDPYWTCTDPPDPDTAVVKAALSGSMWGRFDGNNQANSWWDFAFMGTVAPGVPDTVACDDVEGVLLLDNFLIETDTSMNGSINFDLWEGYLYLDGYKTLDSFGKIYEDGGSLLTGIEYVMEVNFEYPPPGAAEVVAFDATGFGDRIEVDWSTSTEVNNVGFHVLRGESENGPFGRINDMLIPARGSELSGADYTFTDRGVTGGTTYFYRLEIVDVDGKVGFTEPVKSENKAVAFRLAQNYPNPFNPITEIMYNLPTSCNVRLEVYNVLGQRIATLVNEHQMAGSKVVSWNGKDSVGNDVASGVYFYRINAGEFAEMKKMILLR